MGCRSSPSIAQSIVARCFRSNPHTRPFLDDFTCYSRDIDEHLDVDLPLLLATCSKYNILLKPAKCDLVRPETRILGHQISEESMTLSNEKVEKIESLTFPVDKKEAVSKLAFFQYFARIAPRLSELLGPLRDLTAQHKKFIPTEEHRRGFEEAKKHLLDEKVNCGLRAQIPPIL